MPPQVQHKTKLVEAIKGMVTIINGRTSKFSEREKEKVLLYNGLCDSKKIKRVTCV